MSNPAAEWTPESGKQISEAIGRWKPWKQLTEPKSAEGKAVISGNAWTGGHRAQLRELSKMVNEQVKRGVSWFQDANKPEKTLY